MYSMKLSKNAVALLFLALIFLFQNCSTQNVQFQLLPDLAAPEAFELVSDLGVESSRNKLNIRIKASDDISGIAKICLIKSYIHNEPPKPPASNDSCWIQQSRPYPTEINSSFHFFLGFLPTDYYVYVFLMDDVGHISALSNFGQGTVGKDKIRYSLNPLTPPKLINVQLSLTDQDILRNSGSINIVNQSEIYLKWHAEPGAVALADLPIRVLAKVEGNTWFELASQVANGINGSCTITKDFTGCLVLKTSSFQKKPFKLRVELQDTNIVKSVVNLYGNTGAFRVVAGNLESGHGASASSAVFLFNQNSLTADKNIFVVANTGYVYVRDTQKGLLQIEPNTGTVDVLIPKTGKITDGPVSVASIKILNAVYLDHKDNIYFHDTDRIRKYDPITKMVTTVLGGGSKREVNIKGSEFALTEFNRTSNHFAFLPNNKLIFTDSINYSTQDDQIFELSLESLLVTSVKLSGKNFYNNTQIDYTKNKEGYPFYLSGGFGISYDLGSSQINHFLLRTNGCYNIGCGYTPHSTLIDYSTGITLAGNQQTVNAPDVFPAPYNGFIHSLDGRMFFINKGLSSNVSQIYFFNESEKKWSTLFNGQIGNCEDGTEANQCKTRIEDAFINSRGEVYFFDGGVIRTIGPKNKVYTIYGQKRFFGDGLDSRNARFSEINSFGINHQNEIVILDSAEARIRSIHPENQIIRTIAGNSEVGTDIDNKNPIRYGLSTDYWGARYQMQVSKNDGSIYFSFNSIFAKLTYNAQAWKVINNGTQQRSYFSLDEVPFSELSFGYPPIIIGLNKNDLLFITGNWDGSKHIAGVVRRLDLLNLKTNHFLGSIDYNYQGQDYYLSKSDIGLLAKDIKINAAQFGNQSGLMKYSEKLSSWVGLSSDKKSLMLLKDGQPMRLLAELPRPVLSYEIKELNGEETEVYYCDRSNYQMYKFNIVQNKEFKLITPEDIRCAGFDIHYDYVQKRVLFPVYQDISHGISEYRD